MSTQIGNSAALVQSNRSVNRTRPVLPMLGEICASPEDSLDALDIAALNLMCAAGLPGAEQLEFGKLFDWLDGAARKVDFETRRHWYRFIASPEIYHNSPGYFCCYFLLQVLQEEFGVKYNPARAMDSNFQDPKCLNPDFRDSRDLFIHGIIDGPGGTCASMPVVYVAVGRRLGYPLKLVESRAHLFFRWDDPQGQRLGLPERVNIEGAGSGISSYPDDFYRAWPEPWTAADEAGGMYLKSLSPREELAAFLSTRAECLYDNGRTDEAIQAYRWACGLSPHDPRYPWRLGQIVRRLQRNVYEINEVIAINREARRTRNAYIDQRLERRACTSAIAAAWRLLPVFPLPAIAIERGRGLSARAFGQLPMPALSSPMSDVHASHATLTALHVLFVLAIPRSRRTAGHGPSTGLRLCSMPATGRAPAATTGGIRGGDGNQRGLPTNPILAEE